MFSQEEKKIIAEKVEYILLELRHPEMPDEKPNFLLHVDGKESWSWADIKPNWHFDVESPTINQWNEVAREVL